MELDHEFIYLLICRAMVLVYLLLRFVLPRQRYLALFRYSPFRSLSSLWPTWWWWWSLLFLSSVFFLSLFFACFIHSPFSHYAASSLLHSPRARDTRKWQQKQTIRPDISSIVDFDLKYLFRIHEFTFSESINHWISDFSFCSFSSVQSLLFFFLFPFWFYFCRESFCTLFSFAPFFLVRFYICLIFVVVVDVVWANTNHVTLSVVVIYYIPI